MSGICLVLKCGSSFVFAHSDVSLHNRANLVYTLLYCNLCVYLIVYLLHRFLADIAVQSPVNKMSPDNISVVFAPTLLQIDMSTPESAMESLPICQKIVRVLVMRKMEAHMAVRMSPKINFTRFE